MYESRSDPNLTLIHISAVKTLERDTVRLFKATEAEKLRRANELTYILSSGFSCGLTTQQPGKQLGEGVQGRVRQRKKGNGERGGFKKQISR